MTVINKGKDMIRYIKRLFKKENKPAEKIRLTVKNGRLVKAYYPAHIVGDHLKHSIARQQIACYEIKLNGNPLFRGLGG